MKIDQEAIEERSVSLHKEAFERAEKLAKGRKLLSHQDMTVGFIFVFLEKIAELQLEVEQLKAKQKRKHSKNVSW